MPTRSIDPVRAARNDLGGLALGWLAVMLLATIASPTLLADDSAPSLFVERVDVSVVNVEVFVTDRQGQRITGLASDDFEILADGEPVAITNFFAVDRRGYPGEPAAEMMIPGSNRRHSLSELPAEQRLHLMVYIDNYNLRPGTRNRVLRQMEAFIDRRLDNGDQIMITSFNRRLDVLTPFTIDREAVDQAIEEAGRQTGYRDIVEAERTSLLRDIEEYSIGPADDPAAGYSQAIDAVRVFQQKLQEDFSQSARGLRRASRALAGLHGRKALLYVSDGLTMLPGQELYEHVNRVFGSRLGVPPSALGQPGELFDEYRFDAFEEVIAEANANQVTIYTLDARGSTGSGMLSAEYGTFGGAGGGMADLDVIRQANLVAPIIHMAERTGGISIRNTYNFDGGLEQLGRDFESFYSLGFQTRHPGEGKSHRIEVRVRRPGLDVRHRTSYVDKPAEERVAEQTFSALFTQAKDNPLGVRLDFGPPEKLRRNRWVVPVIVRIPARHVTFLPQDDQALAQLRVFAAARNLDDGQLSTVSDLPFQPSFSQADLESFRATGELALRTNLQLSAGAPKIAIGVLDELSGVESFTRQSVSLGAQIAARD